MDAALNVSPARVFRGKSRRLWVYLATLGIVAVTTGVAELLFVTTGTTRLSMVFLAGVLVTAVLFGSGPAYLAAVTAFAIYNFYLVDPMFTFSLGSPEDFINLAVFLAVAMLTGNLTGRIRDEAARTRARAAMTSALFAATREFSASSDETYIRERLAHHLSVAGKGDALVRDGLRMFQSPTDLPLSRELILTAMKIARTPSTVAVETHHFEGWALRPLRVDDVPLGVAGWRTESAIPLGSDEHALVEILIDAGAGALSRARLAAQKSEAETRARTEDLRNALLSSISHDMRTPLAAIMASAGSLRRYGTTFDEATRLDLSSTIEQEAARLDAFVANLLSMTRLESGALTVQRIGFSVPEVVERVVGRRSSTGRSITVDSDQGLPEGVGDPQLFEQVFGNVMENALRYCDASETIAVLIVAEDEKIVIEVADRGPGVPPKDLDRIFEKFFRSERTAQVSGTGLGLSIARGLVEAMGGSIQARNRVDDTGGLVMRIVLPEMT